MTGVRTGRTPKSTSPSAARRSPPHAARASRRHGDAQEITFSLRPCPAVRSLLRSGVLHGRGAQSRARPRPGCWCGARTRGHAYWKALQPNCVTTWSHARSSITKSVTTRDTHTGTSVRVEGCPRAGSPASCRHRLGQGEARSRTALNAEAEIVHVTATQSRFASRGPNLSLMHMAHTWQRTMGECAWPTWSRIMDASHGASAAPTRPTP